MLRETRMIDKTEELIENIAFELINDCCYTVVETIN